MHRYTTAAALLCLGSTTHAQPFAHTYPDPGQMTQRSAMVDTLRTRLDIARPWMRTESGLAMADAVETLPPRTRRWRWSTPSFGERTYTMEQRDALDIEDKRLIEFFGISEFVYYAGWSSDAPLIEFRAFDLAMHGTPLADPSGLAGARVLIVDPGVITSAWALARLGADVTVVSHSQRFRAIYNSPSDRGAVNGLNGGPAGSVTIVDANWPSDLTPDLAGPFDLIVAVNVLNVGRTDPTPGQGRDNRAPNPLKPLDIPHEIVTERLAGALAQGGRAIIYNWGSPIRPNANPNPESDVRVLIEPHLASKAGLEPTAFASDASVFTRLLAGRAQMPDVRRQIDAEGLSAPQISAFYAIYDKPGAEN
ncbi:MAG: hypothetical protein AAFS11_08525 [Planctomycetota bacterium]